jgi:putative spermidine/putrescine transport system permease protein
MNLVFAGRSWVHFRESTLFFVAPFFGFMVAIFTVPLIYIGYTSTVGAQGFTWSFYTQLASRPLYRHVFENTLTISACATLCALLVGYPVAYHLAKRTPRGRALLSVLVLLPFWTSILVKSFAFTVLLGHRGIVNTMLGAVGLDPVPMMYNQVSLLVGITHYLVPFTTFSILPSLLNQPVQLRQVAELMGASEARTFWRVTFPLSLPGVMAGGLISFTLSLGSFVAPALLGGRSDIMAGNLIDFYVHDSLNWSLASAISVVLIVAAGIPAFFAYRLRRDDRNQR